MKTTQIITLKFILPFFIGAFLLVGCTETNEIIDTNTIEVLSEDETIAIVESDDISDELDNLIDNYLYENTEGKDELGEKSLSGMPECTSKTIEINGTVITVTLDFGDECEFSNGHILAGKIIMVYEYDTSSVSKSITQTFENFTFNNVTVEGENKILRVKENENGNPQSTKTINCTFIWEDGETASRVGTKVREWVEGYGSGTWGDNVFEITGNWTTTFRDGTICSAEITTDLRREMACRFIVSGIIDITKNEANYILDFGDGSCDNIATLTNADGLVTEIELRKRFKSDDNN